MIEVEGLTVRFAGVIPIDGVSVVFPGGTCGLIGSRCCPRASIAFESMRASIISRRRFMS